MFEDVLNTSMSDGKKKNGFRYELVGSESRNIFFSLESTFKLGAPLGAPNFYRSAPAQVNLCSFLSPM